MKAAFFLRLFELLTWLLLDLMGRWHQRRRAGGSTPPAAEPELETCVLADQGGYLHATWTGTGLDGYLINVRFDNWTGGSWDEFESSAAINAGLLSYVSETAWGPGRYRVRLMRDGLTLITSNELEVGS